MTGFVEAHATEVRQAADRIRPYVRRTPTLSTDLETGKLPAGRTCLIIGGGNANLETVAKLLGTR